jgi:uncharacterized protein (TIGR03066 family)
MNALKLLAAVAVVGLVGPAARADEKEYPKLIVGTWEVTKAEEGTIPKGAVIEFAKDGKVKYTGKKGDAIEMQEGTYKLAGNKLTVTVKEEGKEQSHTATITRLTDTEMAVDDEGGKKAELTKKK